METTNLSKIRRDKMLNTIKEIKKNITDEKMLTNLSMIENELTKKKYGLIWEEHEERVDKELETQIPTFEEIKDKEIVSNPNEKFNFLLEGDNLHSLYLLEKTHKEKIKMIYIAKKLLSPNGSVIFISIDENECHTKGRYWAFSKTSFEKYVASGKIKFKDKIKNNERGFIFKSYANQLKNTMKPIDSLLFDSNQFMNQVATKETNALGLKFDYPKPVDFIKEIIKSSTDDGDIVLDFFAGTGTTGQAIQELKDKKIYFILCTNNENKICENITYNRIIKTNVKSNLKYYRCTYIPRINTETENLHNNLLINIKNLIQLENGIEIDDNKIRVYLDEDKLDKFSTNEKELEICEKIYISSDILLTSKQENIFENNNIEVYIIPEYYFKDEIMEVM